MDELFLLSFLPTLKKMTTTQKYDFKIKMMQVLRDVNTQSLPPFQPTFPMASSKYNPIPYKSTEHFHSQPNLTYFNSLSSNESDPTMSTGTTNESSILYLNSH